MSRTKAKSAPFDESAVAPNVPETGRDRQQTTKDDILNSIYHLTSFAGDEIPWRMTETASGSSESGEVTHLFLRPNENIST